MAKKANSKKDVKAAWRYKHRKKTHKNHIHNEWLDCDNATKEKLEASYPKVFIFEAYKAPKPTPSMEDFKENKEK